MNITLSGGINGGMVIDTTAMPYPDPSCEFEYNGERFRCIDGGQAVYIGKAEPKAE